VVADVTSSGNEFQSLTTQLEKKFWINMKENLFLYNFSLCPLVCVTLDRVIKDSGLMGVIDFKILKASMRLPFFLRQHNEYISKHLNLSSYGSVAIFFTSLRRTFSIMSIKHSRDITILIVLLWFSVVCAIHLASALFLLIYYHSYSS